MDASEFAEKGAWKTAPRFRKVFVIAISSFLVVQYCLIAFVQFNVYGDEGEWTTAAANALFHLQDNALLLVPNQLLILMQGWGYHPLNGFVIVGLLTIAIGFVSYLVIIRYRRSPFWVILGYVLASAILSYVMIRFFWVLLGLQ